MKLVSVFVIGPLLLQTSTVSSAEEKELIAPIFTQAGQLSSWLSISESSGRHVVVGVQEYTVTGERAKETSYILDHNTMVNHNAYHSFTGPDTNNGWARVTFPDDRDLHIVSTIADYSRRGTYGTYAESQLVEPAPAFRLFAKSTFEGETGIAIVNPTSETQTVSFAFHEHHPRHKIVTKKEWEIESGNKLSMFLSEWLPLEGTEGDEYVVTGIVRVQGETVIAVGALNYSQVAGWFETVLVTEEKGTVPNRAPVSAGPITTQTVAVGDTATVDLSPYFTDIDGDALSYSAISSDLGVASVSVSGEALTITGTGMGTAAVQITASDEGGASAKRSMMVRVGSAARFEDQFASEASLARWQAHHADLLVDDGVLAVIGATPNVAGMAIHTLEAPIASWELGVRVGREDDDGLPSIVVFVNDTTFSAYRIDVGNFLPIRPQTNIINYRLVVYDAGHGRWQPVSGASGLSDEIHTEEGEFSEITLSVKNGRIRASAGNSTLFDFTVDSIPWLAGASTDAVEVGLVIVDLEPDNTAIFDWVTLDGIAIERTAATISLARPRPLP
ncbi:MAG: hypothetical protein OXH11_11020 [Candidatus Aminicenantes bacterium]|nr:hypothetical protein [Candidatus Aminicenantes bacterium]